jgi:lipopolysaccharide biosynthesis glycosyltransferase
MKKSSDLILSPVKMTKYAICTLVMRGDEYVPGALTLAASVKKTCTDAPFDLVCMVTEDVSLHAVSALRCFYKHVVKVPYIRANVRDLVTAKQQNKYKDWMSVSFTKWNYLNLNALTGVNYSKAIFIDADIMAIQSITCLFNLQPPAAVFSNPWAEPHKYIRPGERPRPAMYNPYLVEDPVSGEKREPQHGEQISGARVLDILEKSDYQKRTFAPFLSTFLFEPSARDYARMLDLAAASNAPGARPFGFICNSGIDEQAGVVLYRDRNWTHIHQAFCAIPWHQHWLGEYKPMVIHYFSTKPWQVARGTWSENEPWWELALALEAKNPALHPYLTGFVALRLAENASREQQRVQTRPSGHNQFGTFNIPRHEDVLGAFSKFQNENGRGKNANRRSGDNSQGQSASGGFNRDRGNGGRSRRELFDQTRQDQYNTRCETAQHDECQNRGKSNSRQNRSTSEVVAQKKNEIEYASDEDFKNEQVFNKYVNFGGFSDSYQAGEMQNSASSSNSENHTVPQHVQRARHSPRPTNSPQKSNGSPRPTNSPQKPNGSPRPTNSPQKPNGSPRLTNSPQKPNGSPAPSRTEISKSPFVEKTSTPAKKPTRVRKKKADVISGSEVASE